MNYNTFYNTTPQLCGFVIVLLHVSIEPYYPSIPQPHLSINSTCLPLTAAASKAC
ncbi:uncharacterized protein K441DRAFT_244239 [Cenococcum geophilum 1.58]|uniref:uncharacterized protein n=1 Tax=Cenococcum geophilum 1.58 TaxID=794803 RepID=UPI00358E0021|nr:hypothetical protein K441DRAFT_244239 [Cenococcum geophilum 1.58]